MQHCATQAECERFRLQCGRVAPQDLRITPVDFIEGITRYVWGANKLGRAARRQSSVGGRTAHWQFAAGNDRHLTILRPGALPIVSGLDQPLGGRDDVLYREALAPHESLGSTHDITDQCDAALGLHAGVFGRVDGNDVAAVQLQVFDRIAGYGLTQVKGDHPGAQRYRVQPMDGCIVKIDFGP